MAIGVYGGTFDPPHIGHLAAASEAAAACGLDRLFFMVAGQPWQKADRAVSAEEDRFLMTRLATAGRPDFEVSRLELERAGPTYTIDTVEELAGGGADVVLIAGSDALADLDTWHRPDDIRRLVRFAVLSRGGTRYEQTREALRGCDVTEVPVPRLDVSSSDIRSRVASGRPISFLVTAAVDRYIRARGLYAPRGKDAFLS